MKNVLADGRLTQRGGGQWVLPGRVKGEGGRASTALVNPPTTHHSPRPAMGGVQRIFMHKELTAAPFVVTTSVFCCRKPEAIRKTTPEPLLAEW